MQDALAELRSGGRPFALALLDIDLFKRINDLHSHVVGDAVMNSLADVLRATLRASDFAARTGGDEMVVLFGGASEAEATAAGERIREVVAAHDWSDLSAGLQVSLSIGVTSAQPDDTVESLMRRADRLMYRHKPL